MLRRCRLQLRREACCQPPEKRPPDVRLPVLCLQGLPDLQRLPLPSSAAHRRAGERYSPHIPPCRPLQACLSCSRTSLQTHAHRWQDRPCLRGTALSRRFSGPLPCLLPYQSRRCWDRAFYTDPQPHWTCSRAPLFFHADRQDLHGPCAGSRPHRLSLQLRMPHADADCSSSPRR